MRNTILTTTLLTTLLACGGPSTPAETPAVTATAATTSAAPVATASVTPAPAAVEFAGLKLTGKSDGRDHVITVDATGSIVVDGKQMAIITKSDIHDPSGKVLFTLGADGKIAMTEPAKGALVLDATDTIMMDGNPLLRVADDGTITLTSKGRTETFPFKFENLAPKSKRAAAMIALAMLTVSTQAPAPAPVEAVSAAPPGLATAAEARVTIHKLFKAGDKDGIRKCMTAALLAKPATAKFDEWFKVWQTAATKQAAFPKMQVKLEGGVYKLDEI
jgi:hypothetical protein